MDQNTIAFLVISVLITLIVISEASNFEGIGIFIDACAVISMILILLLTFADFLVAPLFTKLLNITMVPAKNYLINNGQDAVIKYSNGVYYATGYITANIYKYIFAQEQETEDQPALIAAPDKWEKAVMNIHFPFKFNVIAAAEDIEKYRDELETKRGLLEFQYSKETQATNPNSLSLENLQRQINVIQTRIDRIGEGEKPINNIMYIESTAVGVSIKDATDALTNQLNELQTVFNIFDLSLTRVIGRELYLLFKLNYTVPELNELMAGFQMQT